MSFEILSKPDFAKSRSLSDSFICLFFRLRSTGHSFTSIYFKFSQKFPLANRRSPCYFRISRSKVKVTKNCQSSQIPYPLTWGKFQKFISPSNRNRFSLKLICTDRVTTYNIGPSYIRIRSRLLSQRFFKVNMGKPIYDFPKILHKSNIMILQSNVVR